MPRTLITADGQDSLTQIRDCLARLEIECPANHLVSLEDAVRCASRVMPELLVVVMPGSVETGLDAIREASSTLPSVHILAIGPAKDPALILRVLREGAAEYLDETQMMPELTRAVARFKTRHAAKPAQESSGRVISIAAPTGGCGTSMLAVNIATVLASRHKQCCLVDLRLSAGDLAPMLDLQPSHTLAELCSRLSRVDQSMFDQFFIRHPSGVSLLAAPTQYSDIDCVTVQGVTRALSMARVRFPYVVADVGDGFAEEQVAALAQSDKILMVVRLDYTSIRNARRAMDNLTELSIDMGKVSLVANSYGQRRQLRARDAEAALGVKISHYVPNDPARVNGAINKGVPVALYYPSAKISKSIAGLAMSVNGAHR